ncbi:MAG TPA: zf-HC2 domain-containing protein [Pyrinomonadaceae bacterium]|jgi:hypothetical protein|nr:zf-HC2 domain-containing protein [Pyrinomonadaceae bacterium]
MRQETNNEMDLLLRRLGRRQDKFAPDAGGHLDADELNAYTENAMPAAARARYTEHLAECSRCRQLVVQLSASAGVVSAQQTARIAGPSGWKKFLASLFSPMVLRYAVPALGLVVVAAIGVVVMRRDGANEQVSQVQPARVNEGRVATSPEPGALGYVNDSAGKPEQVTPNNEAQTKSLSKPEATSAPEKSTAAGEQNAPVVREKADSQSVAAAAPAPPPAKVATVTEVDQLKKEDASRKQQEAEVKVAQAEASKKNFEFEAAENKRAEEPAAARARTAKSKPAPGDAPSTMAGASSVASGRGDRVMSDDKEKGRDKDSSAETKSVAGRRFRKQGGVWVDTAYDSARNTVNLTRGSEQYRALIADEPSIKTIADQLDGEIIVVWKGQAYRIR